MDWNAIGAITAVATSIGGVITAVNVIFVRYVVRDEISKINGRYLYANGSNLTGAEIGRTLESHDDRLRTLEAPLTKAAVQR